MYESPTTRSEVRRRFPERLILGAWAAAITPAVWGRGGRIPIRVGRPEAREMALGKPKRAGQRCGFERCRYFLRIASGARMRSNGKTLTVHFTRTVSGG